MNLFLTSASTTSSMTSSIVMMVAMLAIFYFLLIRPENKKKKAAEEMRAAIQVGDKITTIGGVVGNVVHVKEENIVIETGADRVRIEFAKWAVSANNSAEARAADAAAKAKADRKAAKEKK